MQLTRRGLVRGAAATTLAAAGVAGLSGCRGLTGGSSGRPEDPDTLVFRTWGSDAEAASFRRLAEQFAASRPGVGVDVQLVPFSEMFTGIDAGLLAGTAPDVFRVDYTTLGLYSSTDQLLDVTDALDAGLTDDLLPALLTAVSYDDRAYGVPHQTDTTAIVYRPGLLREAGITSVPDRLEDAWTWEELGEVSDRLLASLPDGTAPFAFDWQAAGAYRWLNWLWQAGGRLLTPDLDAAALDGDPGRRALEFTRGFFERGWCPANSSTKGALYPDSLFVSGTVAMGFVGNFLLPSIADSLAGDDDWQVTFQPRDQRAATDLGGNALVATTQARNPDLAAEFLRFMVEPDSMRVFCEESVELPTRTSLLDQQLDFAVRPDLVPVFTEQTTTQTDEDVAEVTNPFFAQMNVVLQNELEQCFTGASSVDDTLAAIAGGVDTALGGR